MLYAVLSLALLAVGVASRSDESALRALLMNDYDKFSLPSVTTNLSLGFSILNIEIDEEKQAILLDTWLKMEWHDPALSWNESQFPSVDQITFPSDALWAPDLTLYATTQLSTADHITNHLRIVYPTGRVLTVPTAMFSAPCELDMTYWPHDVHNCTAKFGSWVHSAQKIALLPYQGKTDIEFTYARKSADGRVVTRGGWEVLESSVAFNSVKYNCCAEAYMNVEVQLLVRRSAPAYCWTVKLPAIALSLLTLALFLLPPASAQKAVVGTLLVVLDMQFIAYTAGVVLQSPLSSPLIIRFVGELLLLTVACVLASVLTARLARAPHCGPLPRWLLRPVALVAPCLCLGAYSAKVGKGSQSSPFDKCESASEAKQKMLGDGGAPESSVSSEWLLLGALIDRCLLLLYTLAFFIMIASYSAIF